MAKTKRKTRKRGRADAEEVEPELFSQNHVTYNGPPLTEEEVLAGELRTQEALEAYEMDWYDQQIELEQERLRVLRENRRLARQQRKQIMKRIKKTMKRVVSRLI